MTTMKQKRQKSKPAQDNWNDCNQCNFQSNESRISWLVRSTDQQGMDLGALGWRRSRFGSEEKSSRVGNLWFHSSTVYSAERMQNISLKWFLKMLIMADADYKWYWKHHQFIQNYIFWKVSKQKYNHSISCLELKMKNVKCGWKVWVTRFSPWASEINIAIHLNLFLSPLPAFFAPFPDLRPLWRPLWPKTFAKNLERHEKCFIVNASWNMS